MLQKNIKWKENSPIGEIFANHKSDKGLVARIFVELLQHKNKNQRFQFLKNGWRTDVSANTDAQMAISTLKNTHHQ